MQSGNILQVPFRTSHPVSLSTAIRQYISTKYDQHPDDFNRDLELIDQLRRDAISAQEPHTSGIRKIQQYVAQLVWMAGKFPVDLGAEFTWNSSLDAYTNRAHTENSIRFELANVLFNLAAMYSQLALNSNRATADGLKSAANNFCFAAGVFSHLRENIIPDLRSSPPQDMDNATLQALELLMLAQAQECFWQKAVKDGMKDGNIAKLAARVSDLYNEASESSTKSESIRGEWIRHMSAKHHHFAAAAQYRAACDCLEKRKYGEEVARLRDSLKCVNLALSESKQGVNQAVKADLNGLKSRVSEDLKRADKDNDTIYLQPEPPKSELRPLDRANMVASKVPEEVSKSQEMLGDRGALGKPLFAKLVPYSVHVAASIYADRRDRLVNNTVTELEAMTQRIHELLSSLNLPGSLQASEKPLGLPPGLAGHAEEVRQSNGIQKLSSTISDTEKLKANNRVLYQEGVDLLRQEAGEDEAARRKYGTQRWARQAGRDTVPKLYGQINDVQMYLKQADDADQVVLVKLRQNESLIRLLAGSDRDLEDYVPSSRRATMTAKVEREANALRATLNEINRLESRRRRKVENLRTKSKDDDVNPDLLKETGRIERESPMVPIHASQFETLFDIRLHKYDTDQDDVKQEEKEQQQLLNRVTEANISFQNARRGDQSSKERETALQNLENAYTAYKEILRDLEKGRKFYNDLAAITTRFRDECRNFVYTRRSEAQMLDSDIATSMAGLQLQQNTQQNLLGQKAAQRQQVPPAARMVPEPVPAPMPQRPQAQPPQVVNVQSPGPMQPTTWQEGMPIRFGGTGGQQQGNATWDPSKGVNFTRSGAGQTI